MKSWMRIIPALLFAAAATGCVETYEEYSLNPDGSGKVTRRTVINTTGLEAMGAGSTDAEAQGRQALRDMMKEATGVEAWKDMSFQALPDGRMETKVTAYFADVNALSMGSGGMSGPDMLTPKYARNPDGSATLTLGEEPEEAPPPAEAATPRTDEELKAELDQQRSQYEQSKPMMQAMLGGMILESSFQLPSAVTEVSNFKQDGDRWKVTVRGEDMLKAMDTLMQDTEWMMEQARQGATDMMSNPGAKGQARLNEMLFGGAGPVKAVVPAGAAAVFDYAAEVAAAREAFPAALAALGMEDPAPAAPAEGGGFTELTVAGVQWVRYDNQDEGIRPFNEQSGYKLCLVGRFDGSVLSTDEGVVTEAVTDNGEDLLPENEWDRNINFPSLTEAKTAVVFDVPLKSPGPAATGLARVAGKLTYRVASATEDVDLGIESFAQGAAGSRYGAMVEQVGPRSWGEGTSLTLRLELPGDQVQDVVFYDASGNQVTVERGSTMQMGDVSSLEFVTEGEFPPGGRIVVKKYSDMKLYEAPFLIENVDLLGNAR